MGADVTYLEVPVMALGEAAHQLGIPTSTLKHWLDGHHVGERFYPPVLRPEPSPGADLTWGEMVEADYLRAYRSKGVSLQRLRPFIAECRERFGLRYPLAHLRPFTDGRRLLLEAQTEAGLTGDLRVIYELASGQLELHWRAVTFLEGVDRGGDTMADIALALMPDGPDSPVRLEPGVASGAATVAGVRTEILREQYEAGEDTRDIAEMFRLDIHDVLAALRHEDKLRPLKIA
ncbi:MAG TPA: hypothetical protein VFW64_02400 [Pseudonocardiaceae bacterium]|nr:hypothetical protein [Pseudonocardiaceae bacterium]